MKPILEMSVSEIKQWHRSIVKQLLQLRFRESIADILFPICRENGFGSFRDELMRIEADYKLMIRYRMQGYQDEQQAQLISRLQRSLIEVVDRVCSESVLHQTQVATPSMLSSLKALQRAIEDKQLLDEAHDQKSIRAKRLACQKHFENCLDEWFRALLLSPLWTDDEWSILTRSYPELDAFSQVCCVSALYLSLQWSFDERKYKLLMTLCESPIDEVSVRALTSLLLLMNRDQWRLSFYPALAAQLSHLFEDDRRRSLSVAIYCQWVRAQDVDNLSKRVRDELLPEMTRIGSHLQQLMDETKTEDDPDLKGLFENEVFSEKMQEFSQMQMEGEDVYFGTFSSLKHFAFFDEWAHWFLPFDRQQSTVNELFSETKSSAVLLVLQRSEFLCDSDRYSFCFNMIQMPESLREQMLSQLGADSEAFKEMTEMETNGLRHKTLQTISNKFLQDCYRFHKLHKHRQLFDDVFAPSVSIDLSIAKEFEVFWHDDQAISELADICLKKKRYASAQSYYEQLCRLCPNQAAPIRKLAWCQQQQQQYAQAIEGYRTVLLMTPDHLWTWQRLAFCYRKVQQYDDALTCLQRIVKLEGNSLTTCLNRGNCYAHLERWDDALNQYFKAEFLFEQSPRTWRPIAWASLMAGKFAQAQKYYEKLLPEHAEFGDYMNAGHALVMQQQFQQAIDVYLLGFDSSRKSRIEFEELFEEEAALLERLGLSHTDVACLCDALFYRF